MADQNDQNGVSPVAAALTGAAIVGAAVAGAALANPDNQEKIKDAAQAAGDAVEAKVEEGKENIKDAAETVIGNVQDATTAAQKEVENI